MTFIKNQFHKIFLLLFSSILLISCENNPNTVGLVFVSSNDTASTRVLDSQIDTMAITTNNYLKYINTSGSNNIYVGNYHNYTSKALIDFTSISPDFDSSTIVSAVLTLKYNNYYFQNDKGLTSFNIYNLTSGLNFSTITYDSVSSSNYGTVSQGDYTGTPNDSQNVNINLNNQLVKDWFEYAADSNYPVKNYGLILLPSVSSNTIKGFYSSNNPTDLIPYITVMYTKNGVLDTTVIRFGNFVTLSNAPASIIPANSFITQSGIAYRNILNFDLSKLPTNVLINNVTLQFTLDSKNSFINPNTDKRIVIGAVVDSVNKTDSLFIDAFQQDSITYVVNSLNLNSIFQRWNSGILPNLGLSMKNYYEIQNLDHFVFYSPTAAEIPLRPRVTITYTLRN